MSKANKPKPQKPLTFHPLKLEDTLRAILKVKPKKE